jgi:hypothetical protein
MTSTEEIDMLDSPWDDAFMGLTTLVSGDTAAVYSADEVARMASDRFDVDVEIALAGVADMADEHPSIVFVFEMPAYKVGQPEMLH